MTLVVDRTARAQLRSIASVPGSATAEIGGMLMAIVLVLALGLVGVVVWQRGLSDLLEDVFGGRDGGTERTAERASADTATTDRASDASDDAAGAVQADAGTAETEEPSDRDVVVGILKSNEGRMKQARIVDSTDWSKSKVSMVLSDMEEDGDITKLRVGRENIISLHGHEPDAAGSPFDDE